MLKRTSHIILSFILLISTIGLVVSKHYCKEELVSISFFDISDSCCEDSSCCHDKTESYQLKVDYSQNTNQIKTDNDRASNLLVLLGNTIADFLINTIKQSFEFLLINHSPPIASKLFSYNQAYLL